MPWDLPLVKFSVHALSELCVTDYKTLHTNKEHKEQLLSPSLGDDLGKNACPGKAEQLVAIEFSVEYLKF